MSAPPPPPRLRAVERRRSQALRSMGLPYFGGRSFRQGGSVLRGITATLEARFWRDYRHPPGDGDGGGRQGGVRVHRELAAVALVRGRAPRSRMARLALEALGARGLTVLNAEVPVSLGRYGTAADLLAVDRDRRVWLLEVKTGMGHAFTVAAGQLAAPLHAYPSCPLHHAYLQACATALMFIATYRRRARVAVLHVTNSWARLYVPPPALEADFGRAALQVLR